MVDWPDSGRNLLILKRRFKEKLVEKSTSFMSPGRIGEELRGSIEQFLREEKLVLPRRQIKLLVDELRNEIAGLGPIEALLKDPSINEVMVNKMDEVYVEREGRIEKTDICFDSEDQLMHTIEKIISPLGLRIDESSPMVDGRLADGSRVNAIIPPLSLKGPAVTIRRFRITPFTMKELVGMKTLSEEMASFLEEAVRAKINMIVSGGTGSGKTTFLNVLSSFIPSSERLISIEDAAELRLNQPHVVALESRAPNIEGQGEITIRHLVRNALRMRPDRIIVGEVRGGEALDMLQAMNTGHEGSLTTTHANSCFDALRRLETMVLMSDVHLPATSVREQIASSIDLIIQTDRFSCGARKVVEIAAVRGLIQRQYKLKTLFRFKQSEIDKEGRVIGHFIRHGQPVSPGLLRTKSIR